MDILQLKIFMDGTILLANSAIGFFFIRFWKRTEDPFFLYFSVSFFLLSIERILIFARDVRNEHEPLVYLVRFTAFLIILAAIVRKNMGDAPRRGPP